MKQQFMLHRHVERLKTSYILIMPQKANLFYHMPAIKKSDDCIVAVCTLTVNRNDITKKSDNLNTYQFSGPAVK